MRLVIFLVILLMPLISAGQVSKHPFGVPVPVDDWQKQIAPDVSQTFLDLLAQHNPTARFNQRNQKVEVGENMSLRIVESGQGLRFVDNGAEHLVLIVRSRNPWNIRSQYIYSSRLLVFRLENSRLKLLDAVATENPQPAKPSASFYNEATLVEIRGGKNAGYAVTIYTTEDYPPEHKIFQTFRLFALENGRLKTVLDDLPVLVSTNKCGAFEYENEQLLREIKVNKTPRARRFRLELMILEFSTPGGACPGRNTERIQKIKIYEAVWSARRGHYRTHLKSVEAEK